MIKEAKRLFIKEEVGSKYALPYFEVTEEGLEFSEEKTQILFVRGSKREEDNIKAQSGVIHEGLLSMIIFDLQYKHSLVPSRETAIAITKLQEALMWLEKRAEDRQERNVQDTYEK